MKIKRNCKLGIRRSGEVRGWALGSNTCSTPSTYTQRGLPTQIYKHTAQRFNPGSTDVTQGHAHTHRIDTAHLACIPTYTQYTLTQQCNSSTQSTQVHWTLPPAWPQPNIASKDIPTPAPTSAYTNDPESGTYNVGCKCTGTWTHVISGTHSQ